MFTSLLANRFRIFTDFSKPLAVVFNCFSKAAWELKQVSVAAWELQMVFQKPSEDCTQILGGF